MVANIRGYTPNYSFKLINFDTPRWHTLEYSNWNMVDAMFLQNGTPQMRGVWQNNTAYLEGDRVFDEETSAVYRCLVEHESAELGTFVEDRTLHPTYWSLQLSGTPVYRGEWLPGVTYVLGDIVYIDQYEYFLCTQGNVSSGTFPADAAKWQTIFDATQVVTDATAAKNAAYQFSLDAQGSANDAASSATDAQTAEDNAETWADEARAATGGFRWAFSSSTTAGDPAVGRVAFNNNNPTLVTEMYVSAQSAETGNPDVSDWLITWDDSTNTATRGTIQVRKVGSPEQFLLFQLTGSIVDNGTWLKFSVSYSLHSGTVANGEQLSLGFVRAGDTGPTGTGGGDMLRASNLSDVVSVPTSRTNLGLGTTQIPSFSQVLLGNEASAAMHAATKGYVDSSPSLYVSDTAPADVLAGSLWWDSDKGTLYVRYNDGTSTQWVQAVATPGLDTSQLATKEYADARVLDAMAYSGMQINGSMEVTQEYGVSQGTQVNGKYGLDGWVLQFGGTMGLLLAAGLTSSIGVTIPGFQNIIYGGVTVAQPSLGANDFTAIVQHIEGYRIARLGWGTSNAKPITLAFWSVHHRPGLYSGSIRNGGLNRSYAFTYTQAVADVPQYNVITISGDTTGTWLTTTSTGLSVIFSRGCGTTSTAPSTNTWLAGNYIAAPGQINAVAATTDVFVITGVVILPGIYAPTAAQSPLIMRPFDQELMTCRRYWQKTYDYSMSPGTVRPEGGGTVYLGSGQPAQYGAVATLFPAAMRATPTITPYSTYGTPGCCSYYTTTWNNGGTVHTTSTTSNGVSFFAPTSGSANLFCFDYVADARL